MAFRRPALRPARAALALPVPVILSVSALAALLLLSKSLLALAPPMATLRVEDVASLAAAPLVRDPLISLPQSSAVAGSTQSSSLQDASLLAVSDGSNAEDLGSTLAQSESTSAVHSVRSMAPTVNLEALQWTRINWVRNQSIVSDAIRIQQEFWRDPDGFLPRPVVYRPLLPAMGWGNFVYNIVYHIAFANYLGRPLLMQFDKKDPSSALGWNVSEQGVLLHNFIDWRPRKALESYLTREYLSVTCRKGSEFGDKCGGSNGNFDAVMDRIQSYPRDKTMYSEYSASFIIPFENSNILSNWVNTNIIPNGKGSTRSSQRFTYLLRYTFNLAFKLEPSFYYTKVAPFLARLGPEFVTSHIRHGHNEMGQGPRKSSLDSDEKNVRECRKLVGSRPWLMLTDDSELAVRVKDITVTTVDESFSMTAMHVGHFHMLTREQHRYSWTQALADWFLIVCSPGPVLLRSRVPSAFSFGERSALLAGLDCGNQVRHTAEELALVHCAGRFFDKICVRRRDT